MIELRAVTMEDSDLLFEWANDPDTRSNSISTEPITPGEHDAWLTARLADPDAMMFVALAEYEPVGLVRFTVERGEAEIGVVIAPSRRGEGLGSEMIAAGIKTVMLERAVDVVVAHIRKGNEASSRAFAKAGFKADGTEEVKGVEMLRYVYR